MPELRPAMVMRQAERINVKELVPTERGLAVDADATFRYIGDVTMESMIQDGTTIKRWFGWTLVDTRVGPFPNRVKAIAALLEWNHLREADPSETIPELF